MTASCLFVDGGHMQGSVIKKTQHFGKRLGTNFCGLFTLRGLAVLYIGLLLIPSSSWADQATNASVKMNLPDGSVYTGGIRNGLFNGKGVLLTPGGDKFEGEYVDGQANGMGVLATRKGDSYVGQFKHNLYSGTGLFIRVNHDRYEGEFKDGEFEGNGVRSCSDGYKAKGQFKDWQLNGTGTCVYASGTKATGEFRNGRLDGMGRIQYADGEEREGTFKNGVLNGMGLVLSASGEKYEGLFKNGKFEGGGRPVSGEWRYKSWLGGWDPVFDTTPDGKPNFLITFLLVVSLSFNFIQARKRRSPPNWFKPQLAEKSPPDYSEVLKDTDRFEKIAVLDNEVQAEALDALLAERGIPHALKSYRDSALDGVYLSSGWGHVAAPKEQAAAVLQALKDLSNPPGAEAST